MKCQNCKTGEMQYKYSDNGYYLCCDTCNFIPVVSDNKTIEKISKGIGSFLAEIVLFFVRIIIAFFRVLIDAAKEKPKIKYEKIKKVKKWKKKQKRH